MGWILTQLSCITRQKALRLNKQHGGPGTTWFHSVDVFRDPNFLFE
ncbi:rCG59944 [Rattus norvegicus]|uniref:RCG59944 n=1 Tax=Rattus norvegicus TaxID=10116 RepID=A6HQQ9_RAT|nr:rCG59944 [Rattus norvegicus]